MNRHFIPAFGKLQLNELTEEHIQKLFQEKLKNEELNEKALRNLRNVLRACLELAVIKGAHSYNPAKDIQTPTPMSPGIRTLSKAEQQLLCRAFLDEDSNEALCVFVILSTGATLGEVLAMQCGDLEPDKLLVNIRNKQILTDNGWVNVPNEGAACRKAPILSPLPGYLERHPLDPANQPLIYRRGANSTIHPHSANVCTKR